MSLLLYLKETKENAQKSFDEKMKTDEIKILQLTSENEEIKEEINTLKVKSNANYSYGVTGLKDKVPISCSPGLQVLKYPIC